MRLSQRILSLLLLMAYVITGTPMATALLVCLATFDNGHQVIVGQTQSGMVLKLHHRPGEYTPCVVDHQRPLTRLLVSLCRPAEQGDHLVTSAQLTGSIQKEGTRFCKVKSGERLLDLPATREWLESLKSLQHGTIVAACHEVCATQPVPRFCEAVRSVQLLI